MSKHEIRLRRQKLTARGSDRFRNYGAVLQRHEQEKKIKRVVRAFTYFLLIALLVLLLVVLTRIERTPGKKTADRQRVEEKFVKLLSLQTPTPNSSAHEIQTSSSTVCDRP